MQDDVSEDVDVDEDLGEELIANVRAELEHVYDNGENGELLDEILGLAENNYSKDKASWTDLLDDITSNLLHSDDEHEIKEALDGFKRKAKMLG